MRVAVGQKWIRPADRKIGRPRRFVVILAGHGLHGPHGLNLWQNVQWLIRGKSLDAADIVFTSEGTILKEGWLYQGRVRSRQQE